MTLPPHKIGYKGQKYRIVVDETDEHGKTKKRTIGWSNDNTQDYSSLNTRPGWSNARHEEVEDPAKEGQ